MATLLLVRHRERLDYVEPEWIAAHRDAQPWDPPLSTLGLLQAEDLVKGVAAWCDHLGVGLGAVYSSPMQRCRMTAAPSAAAAKLPVVIDPGLTEWFGEGFYTSWGCTDSTGRWESGTPPLVPELLKNAQIPAAELFGYGEAHAHFNYTWESPESETAMISRVASCIENLVLAHPGQAVLVVSHAGPVHASTQRLVGIDQVSWPKLLLPYTGICVLQRSGANWESVAYADTRHMRADPAMQLG